MAPPATDPALIVAQALDTGVASLVLANGVLTTANLFAGDVSPADPPGMPHLAVFCRASGGPPPEPFMGTPATRGSWFQPTVQVVVRGNLDAPEATEDLARECMVALHRVTLTGYLSCLVRESGPVDVGVDPTGHPVYTFNVELWYKG